MKISLCCLKFVRADGPLRAFLTHEPNNPSRCIGNTIETYTKSWPPLSRAIHCHIKWKRDTHQQRKRRVYLQVQPSWDVETYGAGEKEIRRTLMWLFKVHWTTCDNSHSSCIYSFSVCSSLGDNCLNWCSKCYCLCVGREINSSPMYEWVSYFSYVFLFSTIPFSSFWLDCLLACLCVFYYLCLSHSHFLISKHIKVFEKKSCRPD